MRKAILSAAVTAMGLSSFAMAGGTMQVTGKDVASVGSTFTRLGAGPEATLYNNIPGTGEGVSTTTSTPRTSGADEFFIVASPGQHAALLTSMVFGYSIPTGGATAFDARITVWDDIDYAATTTPQFANQKARFTLSFTNQTSGAWITNPVDLTTLAGGGITVTDNPANNDLVGAPGGTNGYIDGYFQVDFFSPGTTTQLPANGATFIFDTTGVNAGTTFANPVLGGDGTAAGEFYWRDVDANSTIIGNEARSLTGSRANLVLSFDGNIVPEPTSLSALALGGLLLRRRRA